jgi:hypothetical protein
MCVRTDAFGIGTGLVAFCLCALFTPDSQYLKVWRSKKILMRCF